MGLSSERFDNRLSASKKSSSQHVLEIEELLSLAVQQYDCVPEQS